IAAGARLSCATKTDAGTDSNTHWFADCDSDVDCGGLTCRCGTCTMACSANNDCAALGATATCGSRPDCGEGLSCLESSGDAGQRGDECPDGVAAGSPCDGNIRQCWTACVAGVHGQLFCGETGTWDATKGVYPCGGSGGPCPDGVAPGKPCDGTLVSC